jgi:hypothetical protein
MKMLRFVLFPLAALAVAHAALSEPKEETVSLFENRKITLLVPPGLACNVDKDLRGAATITLTEPDEKVSVHLTLLPDPDATYSTARARREKMVELFQERVGESMEKGMQFEELEPRYGAGTYCVFTDAKLAGQAKLPPGEFLHLTIGVKAWPGVVAIFELLSQSTTSPEHQAVMKMLRESLEERAVPLR